MDEIGFMITHVTDNGMIQFTNLGGVANDIWQGQRLKVKIEMAMRLLALLPIFQSTLEQVMKRLRK